MEERKITVMRLEDLHPYANNPRVNDAAVPAAQILES